MPPDRGHSAFQPVRRYIFILIVVLLIPVYSYVQYKRNPYFVINGFTQGTTYRILYKPGYSLSYSFNIRSVYYSEEIENILEELDNSLSTYKEGSIVSRINRNDPEVLADDHLAEVFMRAGEITKLTDGSFDITVAPLVNAWGFGPGPKMELDSARVDSLLQYVGMEKIRLDERRIIKDNNGIRLDVNAIAQGYSVDVIAGFLESKGIRNYLVEIGGEIRTRGAKKKKEPWRLGIDRPIDNIAPGEELQATISVNDIALATSGNYRKFYEEDGVKYVHSINPSTGYPVRHQLLSVTLIAQDCMTADALATACMVTGFKNAKDLVESLEDVEAYFVHSGKEGNYLEWYTPGFGELLNR